MNIFYTNRCPKQAASEHCLTHRNKMIVEYAQLLSTAHHVLDGGLIGAYKQSHTHHPSAVWVRKSVTHYNWVLQCALELCRLYKRSRGINHQTYQVLQLLKTTPTNISDDSFSPPPVAAPVEFKQVGVSGGVCLAYQCYLNYKFHEWENRSKPLNVVFDNTPSWYVKY